MNLVFLSGPQGAGKTTFMNILASPYILNPELETKTITLDTEPEKRVALKICQRSLENFEYLKIARENPEKIVLGNRCIYDQFAFNEVFYRKGWIDEKTKRDLDEASRLFYLPELREPKAIVLNPGFEVVWRHLQDRWKREKKWREEDSEYIMLACKTYERFQSNRNILYIDHEIDLNSRKDEKIVFDWILK